MLPAWTALGGAILNPILGADQRNKQRKAYSTAIGGVNDAASKAKLDTANTLNKQAGMATDVFNRYMTNPTKQNSQVLTSLYGQAMSNIGQTKRGGEQLQQQYNLKKSELQSAKPGKYSWQDGLNDAVQGALAGFNMGQSLSRNIDSLGIGKEAIGNAYESPGTVEAALQESYKQDDDDWMENFMNEGTDPVPYGNQIPVNNTRNSMNVNYDFSKIRRF